MSNGRFRTLLRVAYMGNDKVGFIIPAWNPERAVDVLYEDIPKEIHIEQNLRLIAHVNLGAHSAEDIVISDWQNMPKTCGCGSGEAPILAPCPFAEDIHDDDTDCLCCEECRYNCWADI